MARRSNVELRHRDGKRFFLWTETRRSRHYGQPILHFINELSPAEAKGYLLIIRVGYFDLRHCASSFKDELYKSFLSRVCGFRVSGTIEPTAKSRARIVVSFYEKRKKKA